MMMNDRQRETLALLSAPPELVEEAPGAAAELRAEIEDRLRPVVRDDTDLYLNKTRINTLLQCEGRALALDGEAFTWSVPAAIGTIADAAIGIGIHHGAEWAPPAKLTDWAIETLVNEGQGLGQWLATLDPREHASLIEQCTNRIANFSEFFPHPAAEWWPRTQSRERLDLFGGKITTTGAVDLTLGRPKGAYRTAVLIELKKGVIRESHFEELEHYALMRFLRTGVAPRLLAGISFDSGDVMTDVVTDATMQRAAARLVKAAEKALRLAVDPDPVLSPGFHCRWCPKADTCSASTMEEAA